MNSEQTTLSAAACYLLHASSSMSYTEHMKDGRTTPDMLGYAGTAFKACWNCYIWVMHAAARVSVSGRRSDAFT